MSRTRIPYARQTTTHKEPAHWQDATAKTIERIQQIFGLAPLAFHSNGSNRMYVQGLTEHSKILLYAQALEMVRAQGKVSTATEFWNTFVNTLRTLVAGMTNCDPQETFD